MTIWSFVRVAVRRWPVVAMCVLITCCAGYLATNADSRYFTRTELVFLAPTSSAYPNAIRTQSEDIIYTAGAVAKRITGPGEVTKFAAPEVTLLGLGVNDGWSLRLPDTGGQWASNYTTQTLILDIVGPSGQAVKDTQGEMISRVETELQQLQGGVGAAEVNQITMMASPESTVIYEVHGDASRALGMTALIGLGGTVAAVLLVDRLLTRRAAVRRP